MVPAEPPLKLVALDAFPVTLPVIFPVTSKFPATNRSPLIVSFPLTSNDDEGLLVPIPMFPVL